MAIWPAFERREETGKGLAPRFFASGHVSRAFAWKAVVLSVSLTGYADWATGAQAWFGPIYLSIIGFSAWFLGRLEAICVGIACLSIVLYANGLDLYPYGTVAALWNLAMRILAILMIIGLLHNARRSYEKEWRLARTDPLTGALNRYAFFEIARTTRHSRGWSLLAYADLDGLKKLNDQQGHVVGDACLSAFADYVKRNIRQNDIFARIGGDEFLVYMNVKDEAAAIEVATRLHLAMNSIASQMAYGLKCSIGVLVLPPGIRSVDRELQAADKLMYEAKRLGAALTVATAHEVRDKLYICRHPELTHSFRSDVPDCPETGKDLIDLETFVSKQPSISDPEQEAPKPPSRKDAA